MQEETINKYSHANARLSYPPPPPHFRRRFSTESTLASIEDAKKIVDAVSGSGTHKRKSEESRTVEERQLESSASKRRMTSVDETDQDERMDTSSERREGAASPSQRVHSSQDRDEAESARDEANQTGSSSPNATINKSSPSAPVEIVDITESQVSVKKKASEHITDITATTKDVDNSHREVKRVGSSELASAMALASLAFGKADLTPSSSAFSSPSPTTSNNIQTSTSIHRPRELHNKSISSHSSSRNDSSHMPPLSAFASPQQAQEFLFSRSMSTNSSTSYGGFPGMNDARMSQYHPLYNHQRFNMNVPPEVFLANSKLSRRNSFFSQSGGVSAQSGRAVGAPLPPPSASQSKKKKWVCDFCNDASFDDYDLAVRHERACNYNPKCIKITSSRGSIISAMSTIDEGDKKEECMNRLQKYERHPFYGMGPIATRPDPEQKLREKKIYFEGSIPLAVEATDSDWLSETNCFIRSQCVEAFSAAEADIMVSSKRGRISLYQVGIRCKFCSKEDNSKKASGAVSFPVSVSGIYESVKRWKSVHLPECKCIPDHVRDKIKSLEKTACVPTTRQYWIDSAAAIGIDDTQDGLRFIADPKTLNQGPKTTLVKNLAPSSSKENRGEDDADPKKKKKEEYIVFPEDKPTITPYVYCLMRQVQPCIFSEADRFLSRSKSKVGFAGFECRWCSGHAGLGRYFPSNPKALSTNSTSQNIYSHIQKCRKCPEEIKEELKTLKFEKPTWLRRTCGWRQAFFEKLWHRLHGVDGYDGLEYSQYNE